MFSGLRFRVYQGGFNLGRHVNSSGGQSLDCMSQTAVRASKSG